MSRTIRQSQVDDLVAESTRLRDELMKAAAQLEAFASQLTREARDIAEAEEEEADDGGA